MSTSSVSNREWLTTHEVAERLGWSPGYLRRIRRQGPPYLQLGTRTIRYRASDVEAWIESRRVGGQP